MTYDPHILEIFKKESQDIITRVNNLLLQLENEGVSAELYKQIKGEVHTLKGDARMLGFESISVAAHKLEDLFALLEKDITQGEDLNLKNIFSLLDAINDAVIKLPDELVEINVSAYFNDEDKDKSIDKTPPDKEPVRKNNGSEPVSVKETEKKITSETSDEQHESQITTPTKETKYEAGTSEKAEILNINVKKVDSLISLSSMFPRYSNRFSYILDKLYEIRKNIEYVYGNTELLNNIDTVVRDFSHELAFYDLSAKKFQDKITKLKLIPLSSVFDLLPRLVRDIALNTSKKINFIIDGSSVELDKVVVDKLKPILIHMLQNAVDHGCEPPEERLKREKPEQARIVLKALNKGDNVIIEMSDDGYGLDVERIKQKAVEKGLLSHDKAQNLPDDQIIPFIFTPGFSTKDVSVYSGRGIGMDVVATTVKDLNGEITVTTLKNKGTLFSISLPLISSYIPVTVFTLGNNMYALPSHYINSVIRISENQTSDTGKRWKMMKFKDMEISLVDLQVLFGLGSQLADENKNVIIVENSDEITGFIVKDLIYEKKMLIRKPSCLEKKMGVIIGAVLSGKEKAIPVLNIINLFNELKNGSGGITKIKRVKDVSSEFAVKKILLVENSLVTRNMEKKILAKYNLVILEAGNGKEAIKILEQQKVDMVITDIEMPVMNGVELISYMKGSPELRILPVCVVSSYKTYSSKVGTMGVKYFIDKSEFSEKVLINIIMKENLL